MNRPGSDRARRCVLAAFFVVLLPTLFAVCWRALPVRPRVSWNTQGETAFCCFSPDGKTLVTRTGPAGSSASGPLRLWDVETGRERLALAADWSNVSCVEFSPDGRLLAARTEWRRVKLWDAATGEEWADLEPEAEDRDFVSSCFTPDGRYLVFQRHGRGGVDPLRFWDVRAKRVRARVDGYFGLLAFSPDGRRFALFRAPPESSVPEVQVWALGEGPECATLIRSEEVVADVLAFTPDLRGFASATYAHGSDRPGDVKVWDLATGTVTAATHFDEWRIGGLSFSPDGRFLTARSRSGTKWTVWDVHRGLAVVYHGPVEPVLSPNGQWLAVRDATGADRIDTGSRRKHGELRNPRDSHSPSVFVLASNWPSYPSLTFSADGRAAIVGGLWSGSPGRLSGRRRAPGWLTPYRSNSPTEVTRLWETTSGRELVALKGCAESLFSPDGRGLAVRHANGRVEIWDVPPQKSVQASLCLSLAGWLVALVGVRCCGREGDAQNRDALGHRADAAGGGVRGAG